jgi:hypothetical protein
MAKYEFTGETKVEFGVILKRIRALVSIAAIGVVKGELGGWIEREENLSQVYGDAWVYDNARVYGNAQVCDNAWVCGNARVYGNAQVCDNAWVCGDARVCGNARVYGNAQVCDNAWVCGDARVCGNARVCKPIISATRSDGYTFTLCARENDEPVIIAGCRYFTFTQARTHWQSTRAGTPLGDETFSIIDHFERMAAINLMIPAKQAA